MKRIAQKRSVCVNHPHNCPKSGLPSGICSIGGFSLISHHFIQQRLDFFMFLRKKKHFAISLRVQSLESRSVIKFGTVYAVEQFCMLLSC